MGAEKKQDEKQQMLGEVGAVVAFYCACSGGMLVINKLAVHHVSAPAFVTALQFLASTLFVGTGHCCGAILLDVARWSRMRHFVLYVCAFSAGTWSNMKVLSMANVETVIVFRSCAPLCVSFTDYLFHQRALPSHRSAAAMLLILVGAFVYVKVDKADRARRDAGSAAAGDVGAAGSSGDTGEAYTWVCVWFALLIFQLTYGKQLVTGLGLRSIWSPVLYTNALAILPTLTLGAFGGDFERLKHVEWTVSGICWLTLSCVAGVGISWAGFKCQQLVTATAYTVVGVMNKLLTVLINVLIWDKHASPVGIAALLVCLGGGALYQQAPLRKPVGGYDPLARSHPDGMQDGGDEGVEERLTHATDAEGSRSGCGGGGGGGAEGRQELAACGTEVKVGEGARALK